PGAGRRASVVRRGRCPRPHSPVPDSPMRSFPFHTFIAASLGLLCLVAGLQGCPKNCTPACAGGAVCQNGNCVSTCDPTQCGYDGACIDGGCARRHPGITCPPPVLVAGGMVGPASPPSGCVKAVQPSALPA